MKRFSIIFAIVVIGITLGWMKDNQTEAGSLQMKGVWVSCFEFYECGLQNQTESNFRANANRLFANIKANGCNAVFFHVRSHDDAIYSSSVVGWSKYISTSGKPLSYNPLKILVETAHKRGLKFHAWLNPYRVTSKKVLDPGKESTIKRIVRQVKEIINLYDVDGIHLDDYFYPTNISKYKKVSVAKKKKNVNAMIQRVYQTVKAKSKKLKFGVSPAGNMDLCESIGADVKTWMSEKGYVDYIVPQLYWSDQYILAGKTKKIFSDYLKKWRLYNKLDLPMYIGLALYKTGNTLKEDPGWKKSSTNIVRQLRKIKSGNTEGYVLFSYVDLYHSHARNEVNKYLLELSKLKLNKSKMKLKKKKKYRLIAKRTGPSRYQAKMKWSTSNKKIATVSQDGVVTAKAKGKVRISVYYGSLKKNCIITVTK